MKPLPVAVKVRAELPAVAELGPMPLSVGVGFCCWVEPPFEPPPQPPVNRKETDPTKRRTLQSILFNFRAPIY